MLEIVKGLPDNVIGILARGRVTKADCDTVLRPVLQSSLRRGARPRLYYEIGCRFPGAGWEDLEIGVDQLPQWERIAVVTDTAWVRQTVNALRFLLASEVRVFSSVEAAEGRAWIASHSSDNMKPQGLRFDRAAPRRLTV
jgi:stage II sporulation SpoAA-like protein